MLIEQAANGGTATGEQPNFPGNDDSDELLKSLGM